MVICFKDKSVVSAHRQIYGHLITDKNVVICSQRKVLSPATQTQKCGNLHLEKILAICLKYKRVVSAHGQKCGHLLPDKHVFISSLRKDWSYANRQNYGCLLTDKTAVICSQKCGHLQHRLKSGHLSKDKKSGNLLTGKSVATCHTDTFMGTCHICKEWSYNASI